MKVLFIQDNLINESLALADLAGLLKKNGHKCELYIDKEEKNILEKTAQYEPNLLVVPISIIAPQWGLNMAEKLKEKLPNTILLLAGTYPTFFPETIEQTNADIILRGEAEIPILKLLDVMAKGQDYSNIENLWLRKNNKIIKNEMGEVTDLTRLPLPDRELYFKYRVSEKFPLKVIASGRGCPNRCSYCFNAALQDSLPKVKNFTRKKEVSRIIEEIKTILQNGHKIEQIHFSDDLFTFKKQWVLDFCQLYKASFSIPFSINSKIEYLDEEIIEKLKKANCIGIAVGVETGNENLRIKVMNRNTTNRKIIDVCQLIKKHGLVLTTFNMVNIPTETIENIYETIELNQLIKADNPRITVFMPIPKTRLYMELEAKGLLSPGQTKYELQKIKLNNIKTIIYYVFPLLVKFPFFYKWLRKYIGLFDNFIILVFIKFLENFKLVFERKYFRINIFKALPYYLHTGGPKNRTHVYSTLL